LLGCSAVFGLVLGLWVCKCSLYTACLCTGTPFAFLIKLLAYKKKKKSQLFHLECIMR
jgi:hypothetical protein